jgi:hypothetical protein
MMMDKPRTMGWQDAQKIHQRRKRRKEDDRRQDVEREKRARRGVGSRFENRPHRNGPWRRRADRHVVVNQIAEQRFAALARKIEQGVDAFVDRGEKSRRVEHQNRKDELKRQSPQNGAQERLETRVAQLPDAITEQSERQQPQQ